MPKTKTILIDGKKRCLELRVCAIGGCEREFWAERSSSQSIHSIACWQMENGKFWNSKLDQPKIRYPGEKKRRKLKTQGKTQLRHIIDSSYQLQAAKKKLAARGEKARPSPPLIFRARR